MPKALFLDRDGVINKDINYLHRREDVVFIDGIFDLCRFFAKRDFLFFIITNQAGIGRGYYTEKDFHKLDAWLKDRFREHRLEIKKTYFCPYHATAGLGAYKKDSFDRKPSPGMILQAQKEFDLDLESSFLIGDKEKDIEAGVSAGVGTKVLFSEDSDRDAKTQADIVISSLTQLPDMINSKI